MSLSGSFYVTPTATALRNGWKLCKGSAREYQKLRRHALKLRHFPSCGDWDWIQSLRGMHVGELRIDEVIAGKSNIRVIFFKAQDVLDGEELVRIWTLTAFAKKTQGLTEREISAFRAMRNIIQLRHYNGGAI